MKKYTTIDKYEFFKKLHRKAGVVGRPTRDEIEEALDEAEVLDPREQDDVIGQPSIRTDHDCYCGAKISVIHPYTVRCKPKSKVPEEIEIRDLHGVDLDLAVVINEILDYLKEKEDNKEVKK